MAAVITESFAEPLFDTREILRYSGGSKEDTETLKLVDAAVKEVKGKLSYKLLYTELDISTDGENIDFGLFKMKSKSLAKNLQECKKAIIFAATVGFNMDRIIARYARLSPAKALIMQALGAERIEALCDLFCEKKEKEYGKILRPRFSPGYGDLPLESQRDIFAVLECEKRLGLCLNESLLMSPTKSVTAIVGVTDKER